ncbi:MAG: sigma-70 family RNA polymerase sigma factor [Planctomycetaceae bacterium]|nr:sigma-70 family RNA polymerase sigma factor [Planctomycetaceae bacterium]
MNDSPFGHAHKHGDCYATWFIRRNATALAGKYGFNEDEADDIAQDLSLHLLRQWPQYEPAKGKVTTFIQNVVNGKICELLRDQRRLKRDYRSEIPFSEAAKAAEYGLLDGVRGQSDVSDQQRVELRLDCDDILATLPDDLREIAERLKEQCPLAVARELGISPTTLRRRMAELRERFAAAGYGDE